jgi:hypothetical protein
MSRSDKGPILERDFLILGSSKAVLKPMVPSTLLVFSSLRRSKRIFASSLRSLLLVTRLLLTWSSPTIR